MPNTYCNHIFLLGLYNLKHNPLRYVFVCVSTYRYIKYTTNKLCYGSKEPHLGNDSEQTKLKGHSQNQNCLFPPHMLKNLRYFINSLFLLILSSMKSSDLFHLPQTKDS